MPSPDGLPWQLLADVVLTLHSAIVAFVIGGLMLIVVGNLRHWRWVNALWFRLLHFGAVAAGRYRAEPPGCGAGPVGAS